MKTLLSLFCLFLLGSSVMAQAGKTTITGIVKNADGKPVEGATVSLVKEKPVKSVATNATGIFSFEKIMDGT